MTSQVVQGALLNKGGYGRFRGQCVKIELDPSLNVQLYMHQFVFLKIDKLRTVLLDGIIIRT